MTMLTADDLAWGDLSRFHTIVTGVQGGDKSGHSTYHALVIKADRRMSRGLTFQWNYVLSKLMTDSENYAVGGMASDQYNRGLEKALSGQRPSLSGQRSRFARPDV